MARRAAKVILRIVAVLVGVAIVLVLGLALLLQTGPVASRVSAYVVPRASEALGREVAVREAKLRLLPRPRVALTGTTIAGRRGEPPLADIQALEVTLELWPLVTSLGKDVRVDGIRLVKPVIELVRAPDGSWSYEGLGKGKAHPAPKAEPGSEREVAIAHAAIEDGAIRIVDRSAGGGGEATVAISRIDFAADHVAVGQPLSARLSAAIADDRKNFRADVRASRLPASAAELGPGTWPELTGHLALDGLDLAKLRAFLPADLRALVSGGRADAAAALSTRQGKYAVDGDGRLSQLRLRGEPAEGGFQLHALADPVGGGVRAAIQGLRVKGPGIELGGRITAESKPPRVRFAISGPLLDLGQVLALAPDSRHRSLPSQKGGPEADSSSLPPQGGGPGRGAPLTAEQRRRVSALDVQGTLAIDKVVKGSLVATGLQARAALERGVLLLQDASASFFGGRVDAAGTRVDLAQGNPGWDLKAKLEGVDLGQALQSLSGSAPLVGKATAALDLAGSGVEWASLRRTISGRGALDVKEGALTTADLGQKVLGAVAQGLEAAGKAGAAGKVSGAAAKTELRDLSAQFTVKDGAMALAKPLSFTAPFGAAALGGTIGLDGALALKGDATVSRQALAGLVSGAGAALPPSGVSVPLALGGSLSSPSVQVDARQAAAGLVAGAAKAKAEEAKGKVEERARRAARRGVGDVLRRLGR